MTSNPIVTLFYRRLLELDPDNSDLIQRSRPLLEEILSLTMKVTSASAGYIELFNDRREPQFSHAQGFAENELLAVRLRVTGGLIAHAIDDRRTIATSSTALAARETSATSGTAVICAPVGPDTPIGLIYLQGDRDGRPFTATDVQHAELFARRLGPMAPLLVPPRKLDQQISAYKRRVIRMELRRHDWNMTSTARSLGLGRAALYRALRQK
jgi:hypothetical protein